MIGIVVNGRDESHEYRRAHPTLDRPPPRNSCATRRTLAPHLELLDGLTAGACAEACNNTSHFGLRGAKSISYLGADNPGSLLNVRRHRSGFLLLMQMGNSAFVLRWNL